MWWISAHAACALAASSGQPPGQAGVRAEDVVLTMRPDQALSGQQWRVLCDGAQLNADKLPADGVWGHDLDGKSRVLKFGRGPGPKGDVSPVFVFRTQENNVPVGGAPRCEAGFTTEQTSLPRGEVFWQAFSIWLDDWSEARDMAAVTQWYHGVPGAGLNPPLALVVSGPRMWLDVRTSSKADGLKKADLDLTRVFELREGGFYGRWLDFVIRARLSPDPAAPGFVEVYLDGRLLGQYKGAIGYASPGAREAPRHGIYPLVRGRNKFDEHLPVRRMYLRRSLVVLDAGQRYQAADLLELLR